MTKQQEKGNTVNLFIKTDAIVTDNLSHFFDLLRSPDTMKQMTQKLNNSESVEANKPGSLVPTRKCNDADQIKLCNDRCSVCEARSMFDTIWFKFVFSVVASLVAAIIVVTNTSMDTVPPKMPRIVITKAFEAPNELVIQEQAATEHFKGSGAGPF